MQLKTIEPIHVLYFETETTLNDIFQYVRLVARRLYRDAVQHDMEITGPVYWIYEGADGNPDTVFKLTIALPVSPAAPASSSEFEQKLLEPFKCISHELQGDWNGLGNAYGEIFAKIGEGNHAPSGQNREIYINMDFQNPAGNTTEVQVGIF
jgi:effector-binding domain-containing protein